MRTNVSENSCASFEQMKFGILNRNRDKVLDVIAEARRPISCREITNELRAKHPEDDWENSTTSGVLRPLYDGGLIDRVNGACKGKAGRTVYGYIPKKRSNRNE